MHKVFLIILSISFWPAISQAQFERVYHPYVEQYEQEIEYGNVWRDVTNETLSLQRLGVGYAWSERWSGEIYVLKESLNEQMEKVRGYEAELIWQATEQGEYWADVGLLLEAGSLVDKQQRELAAGLLIEKEMANSLSATLNFIAEYEFGDAIKTELEAAFRAQLRYRYSPSFEPAIEWYSDEKDSAAGPAITGRQKLSSGTQLRWELGWLLGLTQKTPDKNVRLNIELEF